MKVFSMQTSVVAFQAACAFVIGLLSSTQLLHFLECNAPAELEDPVERSSGVTLKSSEAGDFDSPTGLNHITRNIQEPRKQQQQQQDDDEENYTLGDSNEGESRNGRRRRLLIGCLVVYDDAAPSRAVYTSWLALCDANLTLRKASAFPNLPKNTSAPFLAKLLETKANDGQPVDYHLFAGHDTYVAMDNMREYLGHCDPGRPLAYGHALVKDLDARGAPYYTVGGTLVLSRKAVEEASSVEECATDALPTTTTILTCLHKSGGNLVDSRDQFARNTFLAPARPFHIMTASLDKKFAKEQKMSTNFCESVYCLSDFPVAFHKMTSGEIHLVDFLMNWANFSRYLGTNRHSKLRLKFNGSKLPLGPPSNATGK